MSGRLSPAANDHIVGHLRGCPRCAERVERARSGQRTPTDRVPTFEPQAVRPSDEEIPIPRTVAGSASRPLPAVEGTVAGGGTVAYGSDTGRVEAEPGPGTAIGSYIIIDEIARGGMGIVYRANQKHMNRVVALKVLPRHALDDEELVLRFIREARAAAELNHPNVVRVYDIGRDMGLIWYSMELVDGKSLRDVIKADGRVAPKKAVELIMGCARALEAAEAHGIVHRDIKPDNLLIDTDGTVKLADLGLVRHEVQRGSGDLTRAGDLLGTPAYMSPEQARDSRLADSKSDLWSLGATLYHALFGVPPFLAKTAMETISLVLREEVRFPSELDAMPRELRATVKKLLQKDPKDRFQTAGDLVKALERCRIEIDQKRSSQRLVTGSEARKILAAAPKIHRASSSAEHPAARTRRRRGGRPGRFLPVAVILGAAGIAGPFILFAHGKKPSMQDMEGPVAAAPPAPPPAPRPSVDTRPFKQETPPVKEDPVEPVPPLPEDVAPPVSETRPAPDPAASKGPAPTADSLAELRALVSATDVDALQSAIARAKGLAAWQPEAKAVQDALVEQLARVAEVRRQLRVEDELGKALEPVRRDDKRCFEAIRQACTHTIAALDSRLAVELGDAADRAEDLIARAQKGLSIDGREPVALRKQGAFTGAAQPDGDRWKSGNSYFRFPSEVSIDGLRVLALRGDRGTPTPRGAAAWALLGNDLDDARRRLVALAKTEKDPYEHLHEILWSRERHGRLPLLVLADMTWSAGQRATAVQLYQRLAPMTPNVLTSEERARVQERGGAKAAGKTASAPAGAKRSWEFKGKEKADGLPEGFAEHSATNFDSFPPMVQQAVSRYEQLDAEQTPAGLELSGTGRVVAEPTWTLGELLIELEGTIAEGMGVGITLGDYTEGTETVWVAGGYGIRYLGRPMRGRGWWGPDWTPFTDHHDGLWVTTSGLPEVSSVKGAENKRVEPHSAGKFFLRLLAKRQDGKVKLTLTRIVETRPHPVAEGTLSDHLPGAKTALHAGFLVTGMERKESAVIERFSVSVR